MIPDTEHPFLLAFLAAALGSYCVRELPTKQLDPFNTRWLAATTKMYESFFETAEEEGEHDENIRRDLS